MNEHTSVWFDMVKILALKTVISLFVLVVVDVESSRSSCRAGFKLIRGQCYWFSEEGVTVTWIEGQILCFSMNADLASFLTEEDRRAVMENLPREFTPDRFWIGAAMMRTPRKPEYMARYASIKDVPKEQIFWHRLPSSNHHMCNHFTRHNSTEYRWDSANCQTSLPFACWTYW